MYQITQVYRRFTVRIIVGFNVYQITYFTALNIPHLYQVYVEYAVKNPLLSLQQTIDSELFKSKIETFINTRIREM